MVRAWIVTVIALGIVLGGCSTGVGEEGGPCQGVCAGSTTSPGGSEEQTTAERTASGDGLGCRGGTGVSGFMDFAPGAKGDKATPVEQARRDFSKEIEEDDEMLASEASGRKPGTVRVIRGGRVVAVIHYRRAGGGWLYDHYDACSDF